VQRVFIGGEDLSVVNGGGAPAVDMPRPPSTPSEEVGGGRRLTITFISSNFTWGGSEDRAVDAGLDGLDGAVLIVDRRGGRSRLQISSIST
jgi:hypothetical protein